jgi:ribokinase
MKRLCVTGSLHLDVVVAAPHLPCSDETVTGSKVDYVFGGKGGNQALAADKHGAPVYFIGRVGRDGFGETLARRLDNGSIDTGQLQYDDGASGMSVAIVEDGGEYGAVIVSAANLHIEDKRLMIHQDTGLLLLQNEVPEAVNLSASRKAKAQGSKVWLNAAPARALSLEFLAHIDVLILNRVEAAFYSNLLTQPAAQHLTTILTFGSGGVEICFPDGQRHAYPAFAIDISSTHGAGDMFVGSLAARRLAGDPFNVALRYAQAAAALHVAANLNQREALTRADVMQFLKAQTSP